MKTTKIPEQTCFYYGLCRAGVRTGAANSPATATRSSNGLTGAAAAARSGKLQEKGTIMDIGTGFKAC